MPSDLAHDRRRSTRVRLKVAIEAQGVAEPLHCEGETEVVNCHGAFVSTAIPLRVGMIVEIRVGLTGKCARGTVVYLRQGAASVLWGLIGEVPEHLGNSVATGRLARG